MKLKNDNLMKLLTSDNEPKISIILPIHPETPQAETNLLAYKNLLKDVKKDLELNYPRREWNNAVKNLESLILDRKLWNSDKRALLIFANNENMEIRAMEHTVLAKEHVGNTFLIQDLLLPEENVKRPDYLLNISRDRISVIDINSLKEVELAGLHTRFSDYYSDFDANSNVNSGSYGGLTATYHGHRTKSEEQQKDQSIYYQYLDKELMNLNQTKGYTFVIAGLSETLDVYLKSYENKPYIGGIMHGSVVNLSRAELAERVNDYFAFERIAEVEQVKNNVRAAGEKNRVINDLSTIDLALNNRDVKTLVSFNDGSSYSVEHNKLLIKSLINKINCRVLYTPGDNSYPSMSAILR
ncbi:hypothetical protein ACFQAV_11640 [Companilactobacillus huachuanensis]|uniref:Bacterial archaeo-eukaryotic release factor family 8 domain-containing protein n=1 Tax=Companilactobacillus huachuanensis TaxID=2559914 RepID=A0ABW1RPZ5_9LACO|nr:hypothetical protein [Companilactobacillus huachuanensis]